MIHKKIEREKIVERYLENNLPPEAEEWFGDHLSTCQTCQQRLHSMIEEQEIVERYLLSELPPGEKDIFEKHYLGCSRCFAAVAEMEKLITGIREAAKRGELLRSESQKERIWTRILNFFTSPKIATAMAGVLLLLVLFSLYSLFTIFKLQQDIQGFRRPQVAASRSFLDNTRSESGLPVIEISKAEPAAPVILDYALLKQGTGKPLQAEIVNQAGETIWKTRNLTPVGKQNIYSIVVWSSFFQEGIYQLKVRDVNSRIGADSVQYSFPFRVVYKKL